MYIIVFQIEFLDFGSIMEYEVTYTEWLELANAVAGVCHFSTYFFFFVEEADIFFPNLIHKFDVST